MRLEIARNYEWRLHFDGGRIARIALHRAAEKIGRDPGFPDERKRFCRHLGSRGRDQIGCHFHDRRLADLVADEDDLLAARFQNRPCLFQGRVIAADVVNQPPLSGRDFASGERRFEKTSAASLHDLGRRAHAFRRDRAMRGDNVLRRESRAELAHDFKERSIVRHENLHDVAQLSHFRGGADKVLLGARSAIPNEDLQAAVAECARDPRANNPEADQTDIFAFRTCHLSKPHPKRAAASAR